MRNNLIDYSRPTRTVVSVSPTTTDLTLEELKRHLNIFDDAEDTYLTSLITTAGEIAHNYLGEFLTATTIISYYPSSATVFGFKHNLITSITSMQYQRREGETSVTVPASAYFFDNTYLVPLVKVVRGSKILQGNDLFSENVSSPISITSVSSLSDDNASTTAKRHALMLICQDLYINRGSMGEVSLTSNGLLDQILSPFRRVVV